MVRGMNAALRAAGPGALLGAIAMTAQFNSETRGRRPAAGPITPWNPSRRAVARVTNPLPVPECCPHCASKVWIGSNSHIYNGREFGEWPWALMCTGCDSYVGLHPFTGIPLGTLATPAMRRARSAAKDAFNPLWQGGAMTRSDAYTWLAGALGIANVEHCHIGWFDVAKCAAVVAAVKARKP